MLELAAVPLFRFVTGRFPVTPVERGSPVALVKTRAVGVPRAGVTSVGDVARTTLPLPVVLAALIAVPLPERIPVTDVLRVIAGVVVAFATVPAKPFAETTETVVTVPVLAESVPAENVRPVPTVISSMAPVLAVVRPRSRLVDCVNPDVPIAPGAT